MGNQKRAVQIWVAIVAAASAAATILRSEPVVPSDGLALLVLALCAGVANAFPIRTASDGASYRLTNVFVIAGSALLPTSLLTPLAVLAVSPDLWIRRHRPKGRLLIGWLFNASQAALASHAANAVIRVSSDLAAVGDGPVRELADLAVMVLAAVVFTLVQELLVAVIVSVDRGVPFWDASNFTVPALLSNSLIGILGITAIGLWMARPVLLLLFPPILLITHRMTRSAHLAHLAEVDSKTGLHNYRYFEGALEEELAHSLRVHRPLSILFADLDHFKRVNDRHGHAAGDVVLRETSKLLTSMVRKGDLVARFGGEEFVILLPGTVADEAAYLAERIRAAVEAHTFVAEKEVEIRCTVSLGVASCPEDGTTLAPLLEQADLAMYRAKQTRNAVARAEPRTGVPNTQLSSEAPRPAPRTETPVAPKESAVPAGPPALATAMVWIVAAAGALAVSWSAYGVNAADWWLRLLPFAALGGVAELLKVQVYEADRRQRMSLSLSTVATIATMTALPQSAPIVMLVAAGIHVLVTRQRDPRKLAVNLASPTVAAAAAALVYIVLAPQESGFTPLHLAAAIPAALTYYFVNDGTIALIVALHTGRSFWPLLKDTLWWAPIKLILALIGAFLGGAHDQIGVLASLMFIMPLVIMRFTLSFYASKTQRHIETLQAAKTEVEAVNIEKEEMLRKLIETVALIIDARDNSVSGHSRRVAKFSVAIGKELGMGTSELAVLHTAGLFHDLGKVGIPESILHKPSKLTADEYTVIKEHAALGQRILSEVPQLADIARMVGEHHERYDGFGYPLGLAAEHISVGGRILVVADALETMLSDRPYSRARELHVALAELDRCGGSHFDPSVVAAVHQAVSALGADFFSSEESRAARDWGAADQILAQVFA